MKEFNLPRGAGKTYRMLYASEFNNVPILCADESSKIYLLDKARIFGIEIPDPITISELFLEKNKDILNEKDILIDEASLVLERLLQHLTNINDILGCTYSDETNQNLVRVYGSDGYRDQLIEQFIEQVTR